MTTPTDLPTLPKIGPICYASATDVLLYKPAPEVGSHLVGVRDVALWSTDQMRAYAQAALTAQAAEIERLRADAERYRWLRSRVPGGAYRIMGVIYSEGGAGVDAAIDAAMKEQTNEHR